MTPTTMTMGERLLDAVMVTDQKDAPRTPAPPFSAEQLVQRPAAPLSALASEPPAEVPDFGRLELDRVAFDVEADGAVWAAAVAYKARFDGAGATIHPFLGSRAPRGFPLTMRAGAAVVGTTPLPVRVSGDVSRAGSLVRIDRGAFVEEYALETDRLEQRFVFHALPDSGDLVLDIAVESDLEGTDLGDTLAFHNELGRIDYGRAFALDAGGARIALDSTLEDGRIRLVVPAAFVAEARMPLVIDPFVTFFTASGTSSAEITPDVAWDLTTNRWCVTWTRIWTATDHDIFVKLLGPTGADFGVFIIDVSTVFWTTPRIANNNLTDSFLVVSAVVPSGGVADIRGRIVTAATGAVGSVLQISPLDGAYRNLPDVGGDPYPTTSSNYCVVWQRSVSANNVNIEARMVSSAGVVGASVIELENTLDWHEMPRISNSLGYDPGDGTAVWTVAWQQRSSSFDYDIWAAQIGWSGFVVHSMFVINNSNADDRNPQPSTLMDPVTNAIPGVERFTLIVFQRDYGDRDIMSQLTRGTLLTSFDNLTGMMPPAAFYHDQVTPVVDCDGAQFLVGHVERTTVGAYDANVWISGFYWMSNGFTACKTYENFAGSSQAEIDVALCSQAGSGGPRGRYYGAWSYDSLNNSTDVQAGIWDGCLGGIVKPYCFGDGSGTACPCGNGGAIGNGCASSVNPAGANLAGTGNASVSADTFALVGSGMPATAACLFFQAFGAPPPGGSVFGDGLRCVGGIGVVRIKTKISSGGAAQYPGAGDVPIAALTSVHPEGARMNYQVWYRNAAAFCTSSTFNLTNGLEVTWAP